MSDRSFISLYLALVGQVKKQLFGLDKRGMGVEVAMKNELRRTIMVGLKRPRDGLLG